MSHDGLFSQILITKEAQTCDVHIFRFGIPEVFYSVDVDWDGANGATWCSLWEGELRTMVNVRGATKT